MNTISDKAYFQARENFINKSIKERIGGKNLKFISELKSNQDEIKQIYDYNDEYGRNKHYTVHTLSLIHI